MERLAFAKAPAVQRRELLEAVAQGVVLAEHAQQRLRPVEGEHPTGAVFDVVIVGKARQLARGLIGEADAIVDVDVLEAAVGVAVGLLLDCGDGLSQVVLLGLYHAHGDAIHKKGIVHRPGAGRVLPNRHTERSQGIDLTHVLDDPAGLLQSLVDQFPRSLLRRHGFAPFP